MATKKVGYKAGKSPNPRRAGAERAAAKRISGAMGSARKGGNVSSAKLARAARLPPSSAGSGH
jgi:hypothetical protein